jgi:hypothetical protein|tara:strand:+ start:403 stop:573 length:171 start_codon:yes stop_codon:yes gene_type:complete
MDTWVYSYVPGTYQLAGYRLCVYKKYHQESEERFRYHIPYVHWQRCPPYVYREVAE